MFYHSFRKCCCCRTYINIIRYLISNSIYFAILIHLYININKDVFKHFYSFLIKYFQTEAFYLDHLF